jgi:signal transduction histidine kinase
MTPYKQADQKEPSLAEFSKSLDRHTDFHTLAKEAEGRADWKAAAQWYSLAMDQRSAQLGLISQLQEKFSSKLEMQEIYDLTGDSLRDTFNAQVVMISQYDPVTNLVFHHYAIENGQHLQISGWHPIDSSRLEIVRTAKPFMINGDEIVRVLEAGKMKIIPGTELPKTWLGVPILMQDQVIGIISLQNLDKENAFSSSDIDLLTTLTNSLSLILENARLFTDMQKRIAHLAALQETNKAILSTLDLNALLNLIIQQATNLLQAEGGILNLVDWEAQADEVFACSGTASGTLGIKVPLNQSLSGWVTLHNKPEFSNRVIDDPRAHHAGKINNLSKAITNIAVAPFTIKDQVSGTLVVIDKLGGAAEFDRDDLDLLVGFANQAAIAIDNAQLYQKAQTVAVAEERSRLARELHDAVTQTLFSASLIAEAVPSAWEVDPHQGRELLQELRGLSRGALAEMRTLLLELRPASLLETQLEELLRQLGEAASGREGIPVDVIVEGKATLPSEVHIAMYRIAQEALNNVVKHARASHVMIQLRYTKEEPLENNRDNKLGVWLAIKDDGRGFESSQAPHQGLGLEIMQERAQAIGAKFSINSHPGMGTQVNVTWNQGGSYE